MMKALKDNWSIFVGVAVVLVLLALSDLLIWSLVLLFGAAFVVFVFTLQPYWHVRCLDCDGTGICCTLKGERPPSVPHSCCGDCARTWIPKERVPQGFLGLCENDRRAFVGVGWIHGNLWARIWRGGPAKRLGVQ